MSLQEADICSKTVAEMAFKKKSSWINTVENSREAVVVMVTGNTLYVKSLQGSDEWKYTNRIEKQNIIIIPKLSKGKANYVTI